MINKKINLFKWFTILPVSVWMILFVVIPNLYIFIMSFMKRGIYGGVEWGFTIKNYINIFHGMYFNIFFQSMLLALETTVICLLIAYPFTMFVVQQSKIFQTVAMAAVIIPFMISSLVRLFAWITLLRTNGVINTLMLHLHLIDKPMNILYTNGAVILGMIYTLLPFMILPIYTSMEKVDSSLIEAAKDLGAKNGKVITRILLPLTVPGIFAGSILVFIPSLGYFFVSDMLGGSQTILIGSLIRDEFLTARNWPFGSALSIFLIIMTLIALRIYAKLGGNLDDLGV
jgi:spermidine/putrescine transport system permease protein